jgi:OmpA-OmpF porin, OOP family
LNIGVRETGMNGTTKFLLGGLVSAALGWFIYDASCKAEVDPAVAAVPVTSAAPAPAASAPAAPEAIAAASACQGDVNALMTGKTINFQSGSAYLANDSNALITDLAKALTPCKGVYVEVQGHTDLVGNAGVNQTLSQARAETVMNALIGKGVPAAQLTAKGYGLTQPIENVVNAAANAKNRRTVFIVSATAPAAPAGEAAKPAGAAQ